MSAVRDVVIVGAGPAGSAAAYYLAAHGVDVLLLDKAEFPRDKTCGDGLTPGAVAILNEMGLLSDLLEVGRRIDGVDIFAPDGSSTSAPIPRQEGLPTSMLVVPRIVLDDALRRRAMRSGAQFEGRVLVTEIERGANGVIVRGEREQDRRAMAIHARMVVIATGASVALLVRSGMLPRVPRMMLAARAYFEGATGPADRIQIRFDGVPLPGYGWVFPLPDSSANVGAGFFPAGSLWRRLPPNPRAAFDGFVGGAAVKRLPGGARLTGPVKGYPLRVDFPDAPAFGDRVMLVGEAAGLVNPLTGEGIDYALESGRIAAEHAARMFEAGDLSLRCVEEYDRILRRRFERLFIFCRRLRDVSLNAPLLNRLVRAASRRHDLQRLLIDIVLGNRSVSETLSVKAMVRKVLARAG